MEETIALSRVGAGSLTTHVEPEHNAFRFFRAVFDAGNCRTRKVYWVEYRRGQTILRQVLNPKRTSKREDKLIGMFRGEPDLDIIRLAIAAANAQQILTGVRWEIYEDFACTDLFAMGRFDHFDLLHAIDGDRIRALTSAGTIACSLNPADWDFDGILLTHRCPRCGRAYGKDIIAFLPDWMQCAHCGRQSVDEADVASIGTARALLMRLTIETDGLLNVAEPAFATLDVPLFFLDIHATPLFSWIIGAYFKGSPLRGCREPEMWVDDRRGIGGFTFRRIEQCYRRSIFPLLELELTRNAFASCVRRYHEQRIADVRSRSDFRATGLGTAEDARAFALRSWTGAQQRFEESLETLQGVYEWVFGPSFSERIARGEQNVAERERKICDALREYSSYGQELIEDIGKRLLGGDQ